MRAEGRLCRLSVQVVPPVQHAVVCEHEADASGAFGDALDPLNVAVKGHERPAGAATGIDREAHGDVEGDARL